MVAQIAKRVLGIKTVIGLTSHSSKFPLCKSVGCDIVLNYTSPTFEHDLSRATPKQVDIYWDNVAGSILNIVTRRMNPGGRIICCGAMAGYGSDGAGEHFTEIRQVVIKGLKMLGLNVFLHAGDFARGLEEFEGWTRAEEEGGKGLQLVSEVMQTGFEGIPMGLERLMKGDHTGKLVTKVLH